MRIEIMMNQHIKSASEPMFSLISKFAYPIDSKLGPNSLGESSASVYSRILLVSVFNETLVVVSVPIINFLMYDMLS